jgi:hypothetical protein
LALAFFPLLQRQARAQGAASAEDFVRSVYKRYETTPDFSPLAPKVAPHLFSPGLLQLILRDERSTPKGYEGKLDYDPVCACQDADGLHIAQDQVILSTVGKATARMTLRFRRSTDSREVRLHLIWLPQGWRIDDIETRETPSLRRLLR